MLCLRDVRISRASWPVLDGLSLSVNAGEILLIKGPNGIGKTTLLRTIAGLQSPDAGTITRPEAGVAYSGHLDGLKTNLSVAENLAFWGAIYGQADITATLDAFELRALARRRVGALSAGQRRRAGLSRLALSGAPLWVMDEPTTSLDTNGTLLVMQVLKDHAAKGGAAIIATHLDLDIESQTLVLSPFRARAQDIPL
ncbi:MAG: heme ABC exporter ATP-binding protein CcmA [Pseudomonadota bacterium]